jgi:hypothetical protein
VSCRMIGDAGEHVGNVVLRVESVELGAFNQGIDRRGAASAGIGASEQIILPVYRSCRSCCSSRRR